MHAQAKMVQYVPAAVSGENRLLLAGASQVCMPQDQ